MKTIQRRKRIEAEAKLGRELVAELMPLAAERGKTEGAVDVVRRLVLERNLALEKIGEFGVEATYYCKMAVLVTVFWILTGVALYLACRRLDQLTLA